MILIVGDDGGSGYEATLRKRIAQADVGEFVYLTGACSDMAAAMKLASVVISASTEPEAFGRVAVEAQAMGRPVIATDHGGARETVVDGETGWLYPPGDAEALARAIDRALGLDQTSRDHMGLAARARIHARFTIAAMRRDTLRVYERAAGRIFNEA
jgi:glycosyltransferase involved in cell wall biosynthesis